MKKQTVDFSDEPQRIQAFQMPMEDDRVAEPLPEMDERDRMEELLSKLNEARQPASAPETDVSALEDRKAKFEQFMNMMKEGQDPQQPTDRDVYAERDANRRNALILKGMQQAMGGVVNRYDDKYKQDTSVADQLYKDSDQPVKDQDRDTARDRQAKQDKMNEEKFNAIMEDYQNKIQKANLELDNMEKTTDPSSQESKMAQDFIMKAYPGKFSEDTIRQTSGAELFKYFDPLKELTMNHFRNRQADQQDRNLDLQDKRIGVQEKQFEQTRKDKEEAKALKDEKEERLMSRNLVSSSNALRKNDARLDNAIKQSQGLDEVKALMTSVESGNQAALAALGTKLARAMGEVGVLTDSDVTRYVGSTSWGRKLKDWFTKGAQGELPPETLKELQANIGAMNKHLEGDMKKSLDYAYDRFEAAYPQIDKDRLSRVIGIPRQGETSSMDQKSEAPYGEEVERNGKMYKWNPAKGKYQLKE